METGTLYIIASPIGNLEDITFRAIRILKDEADSILCEDTRQTRKLLVHYEIRKPMVSLHSHSSDTKIQKAVELLQKGNHLAYLSDSGTPGISDPGSKLAKAAHQHNIRVVPIPGPSALASLVSVSGFHGKNLLFAGFLSKKPGKRLNELSRLKEFNGTIVIYESPNRIYKCLHAIAEIFPGKEIVIAREMTKIYEEIIPGNIDEIVHNIEKIKEKGEFALAIHNKF